MFRPKSIFSGASLAMVLASGAVAMAQVSSGSMSGVVKDDKGAPVAGATVTLSSPALFSPRIVKTNEAGEWRAPLLPVGNYKVTANKDGFISAGASDIRIGLGAAARQDLVMKHTAVAEATVVVVSAAATVDKNDTKTSANLSAEQLETLPGVDRSFNGAADLAPGLVTGASGSFSVRGGATQNTLFTVNGSSVKDEYQGDLTGTYVIADNIEDTQVILSPLNARNGRSLGGAVNVVTKTGGNDFKGSIRASISRDAWSSYNSDIGPIASANAANDDLNRNYQVTLSGPIWKDRIWFAVGTILTPASSASFQIQPGYTAAAARPIRTGNAAVDAASNTPPAGYVWSASNSAPGLDINKFYVRKRDFKYTEGKLTGAITTDHTVSLSYSKSTTNLGPRDPFGDPNTQVSRLAALGDQKEEQKVLGVEYKGILSSSLFIEGRYSKVDTFAQFPVGDPKYGTGEGLIVYAGRNGGSTGSRQGLTQPFGLGITPTPDQRNNRSGNLNMKWFVDAAGQHEFDFGLDYFEAVRGTSRAQGALNQFFRVGGMFYNAGSDSYLFPVINWMGPSRNGQDASGLRGLAPSLIQGLGKDGTTRNRLDALYVNDAWTLNSHWNLMFGGRFETSKVTDTTGVQLAKHSDFSPRFQARYDLNGDSKHVFTGTIARFFGDFNQGFTDAFVSKADSTTYSAGWFANAADPGAGVVGSDVRFVDYATLTNAANYKRIFAFADSSKNNVVASNLRSPYLDEYTLGYKRTYDNQSHVSLTYVHRSWGDDWAFAQDYQPDQWVTIADPTNSGLGSKLSQTTRIFNSSLLKREYNGLELEFLGKISHTWTWGGNYTYSRLVGNSQGGDQGLGGQTFRDNTPNSYGPHYQRIQLTQVLGLSDNDFAPVGPLANNQSHRARIYLTAELPLGQGKISYAWLMRYDSGNNWSAANAAPSGLVQTSAANPAAPGSYTQYYGGRGQYSFNDTYQVDFKLAYDVPLGIGAVHLFGDLQMNNLFNTQMVATWNNTFAPSNGGFSGLYVSDRTPIGFGTTEAGTGNNHHISNRSAAFSIGLKF